MRRLTDRQACWLRCIYRLMLRGGRPPSLIEVARAMGTPFINAARATAAVLRKKGVMRRADPPARTASRWERANKPNAGKGTAAPSRSLRLAGVGWDTLPGHGTFPFVGHGTPEGRRLAAILAGHADPGLAEV